MNNGNSKAPLIPPSKPGSRPRSVDVRAVINALFYVLVREQNHSVPKKPHEG